MKRLTLDRPVSEMGMFELAHNYGEQSQTRYVLS